MSKFQKCTKVSRNLTGPIMLKSFNCSNHIVLAAIETFQHYRAGQISGNLCTLLDWSLHFFSPFHRFPGQKNR